MKRSRTGKIIKKTKNRRQVATKEYVHKLLKSTEEEKIYDVDSLSNWTPYPQNAPLVDDISKPSQGPEDTKRIGDKLRMLSLRFKYYCRLAETDVGATSGTYANHTDEPYIPGVRVIVFQWGQETVAPSVGDILEHNTQDKVLYSPWNYDKKAWYHVFYDKTHLMDFRADQVSHITNYTGVRNQAGPCFVGKEVFINLGLLASKHRGVTNERTFIAGGTTNGSGRLYVLITSNVLSSTNDVLRPHFKWYTRLKFMG
jgi:hypothetical protein